jgi:hypothetical protein
MDDKERTTIQDKQNKTMRILAANKRTPPQRIFWSHRYVPTAEKALTILETKSYKYAWYQREINLAEGKLHGPFDFGKNFTINDEHWEALKIAASTQETPVDITDINRIIPLKANKR